MDGLKGLHRSGSRPPEVSEEIFAEIKRELSENLAGWKAKEIMNIIYQSTGVRYHEVHIYRLLHKWGFKPKVPQKRFVNSIKRRERRVQKKTKEIISNIPKDFTIAVEDESIFIHDAVVRRRM